MSEGDLIPPGYLPSAWTGLPTTTKQTNNKENKK